MLITLLPNSFLYRRECPKEKKTSSLSSMAVEAHHLHREFVFDNLPPMDYIVPPPVSRKRSRENFVSFLGEDVSSHLIQQMADVDRVVTQHAEKVRLEVMERRRHFTRQMMAVVEEGLGKKMRAKDEEMERIRRLNWALEEKVKSVENENQMWRYLALTNEATANSLRTNLEHVLMMEQRREEELVRVQEDAESCCGNYNCEDVDATTRILMQDWKRRCRNCSAREPTVMLLPCRHLCYCAKCEPAMDSCPICKSVKNGSVHVQLS